MYLIIIALIYKKLITWKYIDYEKFLSFKIN